MALRSIDLMIGDWVKSRGKIEQVREVYDGYICTDSFEDSHDYYFDPIPLTTKILKKNGFTDCATTKLDREHCNTCWYPGEENYISDSEFLINLGERSFLVRYRYSSIFGLRYVHELQHAIRLFGVDKEIVL